MYTNKQLLNSVLVGYEELLRQITQTEALIISHILREPNSIIVLLFICIYIGLRVNACIVNKNTQDTLSNLYFPAFGISSIN